MVVYLQEVLAGNDEAKLGSQVLRLSLATPHALNQLRDVVCNRLP